MELKWEFSAGGVVYKKEDEKIYVLLIRVKNRWSFPKGNIEREEQREMAALREVKEETGVDAEVIDFLGEIEYWYSLHGYKIHNYLMRYKSGEIVPQKEEIDEAQFVPLEEAERMLTYDNDKKILQRAINKLKELGEI